WQVISTWAMGDGLETISRAGEADVNLVVSSVGLRAAKVLYEKFGTPYVVGAPVGSFAKRLSAAMERAVESGECEVAYLTARILASGSGDADTDTDTGISASSSVGEHDVADITLIGEPVTMGSLAAAIENQYGRSARVLCPLEEWEGLLAPKDEAVCGEEEIEEKLKNAKIIVADPLYKPICPKDARFYELPHIAFSGRIFLKKIKKMPGFAELL
ncbi:MAG: oxidoreductase, partial [Coprococcus sp.]